MTNQIDDAFNWLVLVLTTISGVLIGLPEAFEVKRAAGGGLITPLLVLIVVWFLGYLTENVDFKVVFKTYAWFYSSFIFLVFVFFFADVFYHAGPTLSEFSYIFPPIILLLLLVFSCGPFLFYYLLIRPIYKKIYKNSKFLANRLLLVLLYTFAFITFLFLAMPFIITAMEFL